MKILTLHLKFVEFFFLNFGLLRFEVSKLQFFLKKNKNNFESLFLIKKSKKLLTI